MKPSSNRVINCLAVSVFAAAAQLVDLPFTKVPFTNVPFAQVTAANAQVAPQPVPREIAVDADARVVLPADTVTITLVIEDTGKSAADALNAADKKTEQVKKAVEALNAQTTVALRGSQLGSASAAHNGSPTGLAAGGLGGASAMRAERLLGIKTSQVKRAGEIVDVALSNGATRALYVDYSVENGADAQLQAIKAASESGRKKAELLAQSLGVKLGGLLSASVAEDPEGNIAREQMRAGRDVTQFTEKEFRSVGTFRFSVE